MCDSGDLPPVRVINVTYDGSTLTLPESAKDVLWDYFEDWDYKGVELEFTTMPASAFAALPEFDGF